MSYAILRRAFGDPDCGAYQWDPALQVCRPPRCAGGERWDALAQGCAPCAPGDSDCMPIDPAGQPPEPGSMWANLQTECPDGLQFNPETGGCDPWDGTPTGCPPGTAYNPAAGGCYVLAPAPCAPGEVSGPNGCVRFSTGEGGQVVATVVPPRLVPRTVAPTASYAASVVRGAFPLVMGAIGISAIGMLLARRP